MTFLALSRTGFAVALAAAVALPSAPVRAQQQSDNMFAKVTPSFRERAFMRMTYILATVKTTSGDVHDVGSASNPSGKVIATGDIAKYLGTTSAQAAGKTGNTLYSDISYITLDQPSKGNDIKRVAGQYSNVGAVGPLLDAALASSAQLCDAYQGGLGTPCGIRARADARVGTPALSLGYFLDDELSWVVEAYLLAAPLKVSVYGDGPNGLNGKEVLNLKLLPPTAILGKYFGERTDKFRPFLGLGASYAFFYDVRATSTLNDYVGGRNPGDTTASVKPALGFGPFMGLKAQLDDTWHLSLNVGKIRYKTEATLVTRNTTITSETGVISNNDFSDQINAAILAGGGITGTVKANTNFSAPAGFPVGSTISGTTLIMCDLARAKYGNSDCNQGTYTRKVDNVLDNTMFMLSLGRQF